ncbi:unnamed protein product [Auanema sp. JU1783]|nr:unnamed protein product [Auanema sp. JU1783]
MEIRYTSEKSGVVLNRKTANGSYVQKDTIILEYKEDDSDEVHKVKVDREGVVEFEFSVKKNSKLSKEDLIAKVVDCSHAIVIKDLCATCGKDLREKDGRAGQRIESSEANVSMIHHVPELIVSSKLAKELGSQDQQNLLSTRKLVLLVDLDQTIIHTTNGPVAPSQVTADTFRYNIYRGEYHTKLRPYTREFLRNMSKLYEMHIVTYGQRQYAHMIAKLLDPEGVFFRERVLSREELLSSCHKTRNLKALFPNGDQMIAIIDDRSDVWQYSEALVQVKPYRFFTEVGDINSPTGSNEEQRFAEDSSNAENDNILEKIEQILTEVHSCFYSHYDKTGEIKDVKVIIEWLRQQVLRHLVIVLSGVVPLGLELERSDIYRLCNRFGAKVEKVVTDQTTHVIAARWGTDKVHQAQRRGIPVVKPRWLQKCVENWIKADESEFELTADTSDKPQSNQLVVPELATIEPMRKEVMMDMANEVDEALSDESDSSSDSSGSSSSSSSSSPSDEQMEDEEGEEGMEESDSIPERAASHEVKYDAMDAHTAEEDNDDEEDHSDISLDDGDDDGSGDDEEDEDDDLAALIEREISER